MIFSIQKHINQNLVQNNNQYVNETTHDITWNNNRIPSKEFKSKNIQNLLKEIQRQKTIIIYKELTNNQILV